MEAKAGDYRKSISQILERAELRKLQSGSGLGGSSGGTAPQEPPDLGEPVGKIAVRLFKGVFKTFFQSARLQGQEIVIKVGYGNDKDFFASQWAEGKVREAGSMPSGTGGFIMQNQPGRGAFVSKTVIVDQHLPRPVSAEDEGTKKPFFLRIEICMGEDEVIGYDTWRGDFKWVFITRKNSPDTTSRRNKRAGSIL